MPVVRPSAPAAPRRSATEPIAYRKRKSAGRICRFDNGLRRLLLRTGPGVRDRADLGGAALSRRSPWSNRDRKSGRAGTLVTDSGNGPFFAWVGKQPDRIGRTPWSNDPESERHAGRGPLPARRGDRRPVVLDPCCRSARGSSVPSRSGTGRAISSFEPHRRRHRMTDLTRLRAGRGAAEGVDALASKGTRPEAAEYAGRLLRRVGARHDGRETIVAVPSSTEIDPDIGGRVRPQCVGESDFAEHVRVRRHPACPATQALDTTARSSWAGNGRLASGTLSSSGVALSGQVGAGLGSGGGAADRLSFWLAARKRNDRLACSARRRMSRRPDADPRPSMTPRRRPRRKLADRDQALGSDLRGRCR